MRFFKADLRRACTEPVFRLCLVLALGCALGPWLAASSRLTASGRWLAGHDGLLPFVYPLLAAAPYGIMSLRERQSGMERSIRLALGRKSYRFPRLAVVWCTGAAALTAPALLLSLLTLHFPRELIQAPLCGAAFAGLTHGLGLWNRRAYIPLLGPWVLCLLLTYAAPYLDAPALWPPLWWSPALQPGWGSLSGSAAAMAALMLLSLILTALYREEDGPC